LLKEIKESYEDDNVRRMVEACSLIKTSEKQHWHMKDIEIIITSTNTDLESRNK
jgi:hypothetical protein